MSTEPSKSVLSIMSGECSESRHESMFLPMTTRADRRVGSALAELGVPPSRRVSSSVPVLHVCMLPSGAPWDFTRWRCPRPLARARTSGFAKGGLDGRGDAYLADEQGRHLGGFGIPGAGNRSAVSGGAVRDSSGTLFRALPRPERAGVFVCLRWTGPVSQTTFAALFSRTVLRVRARPEGYSLE